MPGYDSAHRQCNTLNKAIGWYVDDVRVYLLTFLCVTRKHPCAFPSDDIPDADVTIKAAGYYCSAVCSKGSYGTCVAF